MAKNQFNPDYPSTYDEAIKDIKEQVEELKNAKSVYLGGIRCGLNISLELLTQLKKNMKKERK